MKKIILSGLLVTMSIVSLVGADNVQQKIQLLQETSSDKLKEQEFLIKTELLHRKERAVRFFLGAGIAAMVVVSGAALYIYYMVDSGKLSDQAIKKLLEETGAQTIINKLPSKATLKTVLNSFKSTTGDLAKQARTKINSAWSKTSDILKNGISFSW